MVRRRPYYLLVILAVALNVAACGGKKQADEPLSEQELKKGIGPIEHVQLGPINPQLVRQGEQIFRSQCMKCHMLDQKILAPPLRDVTNRRSPEFIMNIILNPNANVMRHPALRKYHEEFTTYMTDTGLDSTASRKVLEYLRSAAPDTT